MTDESSHTLHCLNKTKDAISLNEQLSRCIFSEDAVILIEDGVYQVLDISQNNVTHPSSAHNGEVQHWSLIANVIYILEEDALARGISLSSDTSGKLVFVSYQEFVSLSLKYKKTISWY